jgi:hypothetical protein
LGDERISHLDPLDVSWMTRANCRRLVNSGELSLERRDAIFFPTRSYTRANMVEAKAICHACFVRPECLEYALITCEDQGIWGETTEMERRILRRQRKQKVGA